MIIRNGFVSNSSASSFIIDLQPIPESFDRIGKLILEGKTSRPLTIEVADHRPWNDICEGYADVFLYPTKDQKIEVFIRSDNGADEILDESDLPKLDHKLNEYVPSNL